MSMTIKIIRLEETESTNTFLRGLGPSSGEDMVVAVAEYQTAGRGQGSNKWESEPGRNLLFSIRTRPRGVPADRSFALSMAGALALKDTLDGYAADVTLKWPNDVYWRDRKISGTLIETAIGGRYIKDCIYGVGINVNQRVFRSGAPNPVSLCEVVGRELSKEELLDRVLGSFERRYAMVLRGEYGCLAADYDAALYRRRGIHPFSDDSGRFMAEIVGVEADGRLVLRDDGGCGRKYAFKEINYII